MSGGSWITHGTHYLLLTVSFSYMMSFFCSRISQTRTYTRNVGVNTYTNVKNYTWDPDGQLSGVEAQEPWGFRYDDNGNMLSLTYRYTLLCNVVKAHSGKLYI